jgi:hypothetical protein
MIVERYGREKCNIGRNVSGGEALSPSTKRNRRRYGRLPAAIRLLDTVSSWMEETAARKGPRT